MNHFKKIYCRTFQAGLKFALPFLPYRKPKILGSVKSIPEVLDPKVTMSMLPFITAATGMDAEELEHIYHMIMEGHDE